MTNAQLSKTFFPGVRKEISIQGITLLQTAEGEKRIKLDCLMPLNDGRLTGMPGWVAEAYETLAEEETVERFTKFDVELEAMSLFIHTTEDQQQPAQTLYNVQMSAFSMVREEQAEDEEDLSDVCLKFVAKVPSNPKLWSWIYPYHRKSCFIRFETTQADLEDKPAPAEKQLTLEDSEANAKGFFGNKKTLVGDAHDDERREANGKAHDAEFAPPAKRGRSAQANA